MTLRAASQAILTIEEVRADTQCGCVTDTTPDDDTITSYIHIASDVVAITTGMRIAGRQTLVARPQRCATEIVYCNCCGLDVIPLGDEDPTVTQVKIDGEVLAADYWWMHWDRVQWVLARKPLANETTPRRWPSTQKRWLADTETDTFSITFTRGMHVDDHLIKQAALEIVCHLATEDTIRDRTIEGATSLELGGVRVEVSEELLERVRSGEMGPMTRRMLGVYAPTGRSYSMLWAPELTMGWELGLEVAP